MSEVIHVYKQLEVQRDFTRQKMMHESELWEKRAQEAEYRLEIIKDILEGKRGDDRTFQMWINGELETIGVLPGEQE